jgi:hypothetical protein
VAVPQVLGPAAPQGFHQVTYRRAGVRLDLPRSWIATPQSPPLVTVISSDGAVIALWRYAGSYPEAVVHPQYASRRLIAEALRRQPKLHILASGVHTVDGHPAVELDSVGLVGSVVRRVRSLHVFSRGSEVVLEQYASPTVFERVNRQVFERVSRSLVILGS